MQARARDATAPTATLHLAKSHSLDFSAIEREMRSLEPPPPPNWLVKGYIERNTLSIVSGAPDSGKSTLLMRLAANLSRGLDLHGNPRPDGQRDETCWAASEESASTVTAKAQLANATPTGVQLLPRTLRDHVLGKLGSQEHAEALGRWLSSKGYSVLVLDHLYDWTGIEDSNNQGDVRRALLPLSEMAETYGVTVTGIWHNGKGQVGSAKNAVAGSVAVTAVARSVLGVYKIQEKGKADRFYAARAKGNVGANRPSLIFQIKAQDKDGYPWAEVVGTSALTANDLQGMVQRLPGDADREVETVNLVEALFRDMFAGNQPRTFNEILPEWKKLGRSERQLRRELPKRVKAGQLREGYGGEREGKKYMRSDTLGST